MNKIVIFLLSNVNIVTIKILYFLDFYMLINELDRSNLSKFKSTNLEEDEFAALAITEIYKITLPKVLGFHHCSPALLEA
jgi:hypothetical protein